MRFAQPRYLLDGDMSQSTLYSNSAQIRDCTGYSIQAVYTGSPVGTLILQASNDNNNWTDITGTSVSVSAAGSQMWNVSNAYYAYVRVKYTKTSGSGTLSILGCSKDVSWVF